MLVLTIKLLMILTILFSYILVTTNNAIYSALSLIFILITSSFFLWIVGAEFLSMMYIIVYLGAVSVLFLFVVMMLNIDERVAVKPKVINNLPVLKLNFINFLNFFFDIYNFIITSLIFFSVLLILTFPLTLFPNLNLNIVQDERLILKLNLNNYLDNLNQIANLIYFEFGIVFILSSFILLIAMIGCILITLKKNNLIKKQNINRQVNKNLKNSISIYKIINNSNNII